MAFATIDAHRRFSFRVDPYDISWGYSLRTQTTDTYGGKVVQILGIELTTLSINTVAGGAGFPYIQEMIDFFREMGLWQQREQQPATFIYPPKGYNLKFWGQRFSYDNALNNVVYPISITGTIQTDVGGNLTKSIMTDEIKKLAEGIGYVRNIYNDPDNGADNIKQHADAVAQGTVTPGPTSGSSSTPVGGPVLGQVAGFNDSQDPTTFGWQRAAGMAPFSWQGHNFGQVAGGTEGLWTALLNELVPQIPGGLNSNIGGYENRNNVNNPSAVSFHAFGLALDINSDANPNGAPGYGRSGQYVIPAEVAHALAAKYGMLWGGDFNGTPDPMHFEIHVSRENIKLATGG